MAHPAAKTPADLAATARLTGCKPYYRPETGKVEYLPHRQPGYWPIAVVVKPTNVEVTPAGTTRHVYPVSGRAA